ncbi:MAG: hypothetical protein ABSF84_08395 [Acidimicrobiales bacterium]|jgi:hypothetical protein
MPENPGPVTGAPASFLRMSVILTGFEDYELMGTGMLEEYYGELLRIIGAREASSLFSALDTVTGDDPAEFRRIILDDPRYGPVARNVATMWYLGTWSQLPRDWRNAYGAMAHDDDHVVSAAAYREGLVWPASGTHPMGAKQPGFASWTSPPRGMEAP